jgi:hypothetical protein
MCALLYTSDRDHAAPPVAIPHLLIRINVQMIQFSTSTQPGPVWNQVWDASVIKLYTAAGMRLPSSVVAMFVEEAAKSAKLYCDHIYQRKAGLFSTTSRPTSDISQEMSNCEDACVAFARFEKQEREQGIHLLLTISLLCEVGRTISTLEDLEISLRDTMKEAGRSAKTRSESLSLKR